MSLKLLNWAFSEKAALVSEAPIATLTYRAWTHPSGLRKLQITSKAGNEHSPVFAELPRHRPYKEPEVQRLCEQPAHAALLSVTRVAGLVGWLTPQASPSPASGTLPRDVLSGAPPRRQKMSLQHPSQHEQPFRKGNLKQTRG